MASLPKDYLTPEDYLARERAAETKSEYFDGEVFAMAGASRAHNLIVFNVASRLGPQLRGGRCEAYVGDMRVKVSATGLYTYPDVVVVCGNPQLEDDHLDTLLNPSLIIEVLSPSTESYDRGQKFAHYRRLESLQEYVLIAQDRVHVERFVRQPDGQWLFLAATDPARAVPLSSIDGQLALSEVYERVEFGDRPPPLRDKPSGDRPR
jgi:Uma2 family endonuclease